GLVRIQVKEAEDAAPVAVRDTALLPPGGTVLTDVLENDEDPAGGVLAVQGIDVPQGHGLHVGIMHDRMLRISSDRALTEGVTMKDMMFYAVIIRRYEDQDEAITFRAIYSITEEDGRTDLARIAINVQAKAEGSNSAPEPEGDIDRAYSGELIRISVQTYGI